ncbi:hypothetical protein JCM8547_007731 [Rhodosporidiobolus lusitaniae]
MLVPGNRPPRRLVATLVSPPRPSPSLPLLSLARHRATSQPTRAPSPSLLRTYHHSSPHAPASHNSSSSPATTAKSPTPHRTNTKDAPGTSGIAYSRHELVAEWHKAARDVSPLDIRWNAKDAIEANYRILRPNGTIEEPTEKLDKSAVIERFGLLPRDLRSIDAHILDVRPALIVAEKSLIICTPIVRAIIAADCVVLIGTDKDNPICDEEQSRQMAESVQRVMEYLDMAGGATDPKKAPFELRALEALLLLTVRGLKDLSIRLQERVYKVIPQLRFGVSPAELRDLLEVKRTVEDCLMGGRAMQSALAEVLADDQDLAHLYVSDAVTGKKRSVEDHVQAELLLEYYERRLDETSESCERLSSMLAEVDSNINLVLASTRVRLQNLELQTAIGTLALGAGATISSVFGMNLTSGLEDHPWMFWAVTSGSVTLMLGVTAIGYVRLMRARRSQLFLRSALKPRQDEELSPFWRAGPVNPPTRGEVKMVAEGKKAEKKEEGRKKEEEPEEAMKKKDGSQL